MKNSAKLPKPPPGLSAEARRIWTELVQEWSFERHHLLILENALRSLDVLRSAEKDLQQNGLTSVDRFGQRKPNPAAVIARDSRSSVLQAFRSLGLDISSAEAAMKR